MVPIGKSAVGTTTATSTDSVHNRNNAWSERLYVYTCSSEVSFSLLAMGVFITVYITVYGERGRAGHSATVTCYSVQCKLDKHMYACCFVSN